MRSLSRTLTIIGVSALIWAGPQSTAALQETPAGELRVTLDRLLSEHAFLTVQAMHANVTSEAQFAAAAEAVEQNTSELVAAIEGVYGADAGQAFGDLWRSHIGYVVDYMRAYHADDESGQERARQGMKRFQNELAAFLAGANPELSERDVESLLEDHLSQLEQVAAVQERDYDSVYQAARQAHHHMFEIGDGLAAAIAAQFRDTFTGRDFAFGPAMDLRITLDGLLGEHAFLAAEVMRMAETSEAAADAAAGALSANGESLRGAIADIYGNDAAAAFAEVWEEHNGHYVDYVRARVNGDESAMRRAEAGLAEFGAAVTEFFASAGDPVDADAIRTGLNAHTDQLIAQVDAYHEGDYEAAFSIAREAYRHMGAISDVLATGIANQFPERFLPDTATAKPTSLSGWTVVVLAALALALGVAADVTRRSAHRA